MPDLKNAAETLSAVIAALTALATAIALAGAVLVLSWLKNIGLPTDLGVVSSLPNSFVLATGLSFIGLPTVLALIVTALGAFVVGPPEHRARGNVRVRWPWKISGQVLVWGLAVLAFCGLPLLTTIGGSGAAWYVWAASVVVGCVVAGGLRFLWGGADGRVELKPIVATLPTVFILGVFILGWAFASAINRGGFPSAHVCTTDGSSFAGFLVSESPNRTFVGEPRPDVDVLAFTKAAEGLGPVILEAALSANKAKDRKASSTAPVFRPEERLPIPGQAKPPPEGADVLVVLLESIFSNRGQLSPHQRLEALADSPLPVVAIGIQGRGEDTGRGSIGAQARMAKEAELTVLTRPTASELTKPLRKALEDERGSQRIVSLPGGRVARTFIGTDPEDKEASTGLCPPSANPDARTPAP